MTPDVEAAMKKLIDGLTGPIAEMVAAAFAAGYQAALKDQKDEAGK
jgi:hypothetical protein